MLTLWQTCSTSGGSSERGSSENPAFSTEETTSKTSAGSDGSSATSSLWTIHLLLTFSTQKMLWVPQMLFVSAFLASMTVVFCFFSPPRLLRCQSNPGLTIWMTQSCWTCCLSLRDSAKKKRFTEFCRTCEAGSSPDVGATSDLLSPLCPLLRSHLSDSGRSSHMRPLLSLPQEEALESHCGTFHVSSSQLSSPGDLAAS